MKNKYVLPVIIGAVLGVISVIVSRVPAQVADWSGMRVIANHIGYLLGTLLLAYINAGKWSDGFIAGTLTMFTANVTYYVIIHFGGKLELFPGHNILTELDALVWWTVIGAACAALSATIIKYVLHGKALFFRYGAAASWYGAMLFVIYMFDARRVINSYNSEVYKEHGYLTEYYGGRNFAGDMFSIIFAFVLVTVIFILLTIKVKRSNRYGENT